MLINVYSLALMQNHYPTTILILSNCHNQTHISASHVTFSHGSTRSSSHSKLHHKYSASNLLRNSYFCRLSKIWNSLPLIDLNQSFTSIRSLIIGTFWDHFTANFNSDNPCTFHFTCLCHNCYCNSLAVNFS